MKYKLPFVFMSLFLLTAFLCANSTGFAQGDNPNIDALPFEWIQNMRTRPYPFISADNSYGTYRGRLYLVYASNSPAGNGNKPDIFCRYSDDQGATWSSAVTVNDEVNSQNHHQWHPSIWTDKQTVAVIIDLLVL